jgi:hypothetical protein
MISGIIVTKVKMMFQNWQNFLFTSRVLPVGSSCDDGGNPASGCQSPGSDHEAGIPPLLAAERTGGNSGIRVDDNHAAIVVVGP